MTAPTPFKAWRDSRKHLDDAIQRYLEHSQALETAIIHREDDSFGCGALEELFAEVREEQSSVSPRSEKVGRAGVALNRVYNQSTAFVPIRSLPHDVLVYIFTLARDECRFSPGSNRWISRCQITRTMLAVTHVCADWRRLAISAPRLWTHVDIIDKGPYTRRQGEWDKMWLERAGSAPLSVQVAFRHSVQSDYTEGALNWLAPHLGSVRSLGFHADTHRTLQAALAFWMSNGTPGAVQELILTGRSEPLLRYNDVIFMDDPSLGYAVCRSFLAPIRILRLKHVSMSWFSVAYRDLVHLELVFIPPKACPTTLAMTDCSCPAQMEPGKYSRPGNIELNALERLDLVELSPDPCSTLLPVINPGSGELSLRLEAPIDPTNAGPVLSFLNRSNVTKLYIKAYYNWFSAVDCFATINDLRVLAIDFNGITPGDCNAILKALLPEPSKRSTRRWPNLHTLWLIEGAVELDIIKNVVEAYHLRTLTLSLGREPYGQDAWEQLEPLVHLITEENLLNIVMADWDTRF
ncbi:hypothetical protein FRC06_003231 [Ceratobasidium sp. 370]|nr:hypothetical protein FRC06_003231 [Ceratobasidium sp. 370]